MSSSRLTSLVVLGVMAGLGLQTTWARDLRITIPKRSELTPVQRLNRDGVDAIRKHAYEKAEALFYKAYLYDPADPFTLNNLGYIAELQGELDRAQNFYALASEQGSDALIDLSNTKQLQGKPMTYALSSLKDVPMRVNRMNVQAIELLSQDRNIEADFLLRQALTLQPSNPFTLNNLGVAEEANGDFEAALKNYDAASEAHSTEPVVVTLKRSWRGKPVSEMAADSARQLRKRMEDESTMEARATLLTFRGVAATNRNDWSTAKQDFLEAYSLDPGSAFSLNNLGYVAEKDGDLETAQFYYSKARTAADADARIGLATQRLAEGQRLFTVSAESGHDVTGEIDRYSEARRRQTGPVELVPRVTPGNNAPQEPGATPQTPPSPGPAPHVSQPSLPQPPR